MITVDYITPDGELKRTMQVPAGRTLDELAVELHPEEEGKFPCPTIAIVGDTPAVKARGDWKQPLKAGACIQFRQIAMGGGGGGGGKNPLQMVFQIAIIVIATAATWYLGGAGGPLVAAGMSAAMAGFTASMVGLGIMLLGSLLMGALFKQQTPKGQIGSLDAAQSSPTYSINSSGNQARLYQVEPEGFGRMKIIPDFVANTWMQYVGNEQIGYFVYGIGRGNYEIESCQFGETVFWKNGQLIADTGYAIQDFQIVKPGESVTIFPDNVESSSEVAGQELFAPNSGSYHGAIGPYTVNSAGTHTTRLLFDFAFQQGIGHYSDKGELQYYNVTWLVEAQQIDDFGNAKGGWFTLEHCNFGAATLTPQRITKGYNVAKGRYRVRCRRTSNTAGDGRTMDSLVWGAVRAILPGTLSYPITCIAFSIRATNALTQNASRQFSVIATRKLPLYNRQTKTWSGEVATRSWAAAVSHVCKCKWGGQITDANIDLDTLWAIDERLRAKGWYYDSYIDGANLVWGLLSEMCQSQCVLMRLIGPVLSFVEDGPNRPPSFALTPRNIVRGSFGITYATWSDETPDDVNLEYLDNAYGFQQRDVTAVLPESESKEPANLSILGITDRAHAHKVAVAYAAHNRWQRVVVECQVEALGRIINRGDICSVAHPRFKNTAAGAVASWDAEKLQIDLIQDMTRMLPEGVSDAKPIYLGLIKPDGSIWGPCLLSKLERKKATLSASDYSNLLLQGQGSPFDWITAGENSLPTTWIVYTGKTYQRLMVVESVTTQDALHYSLKLLNYDPRIYQYQNLPVPPWQGRQQLPSVDTPLTAPMNFRGIIKSETEVLFVWESVLGADWYELQTSTDGKSWVSLGRSNLTQMQVTSSTGPFYGRVRAANLEKTGTWSATWFGNTSNPPPLPPTLSLQDAYVAGSATITWQPVGHADSYVVALRQNPNAAPFYTEAIYGTQFHITPELQSGGPYRNLTIGVTAVNQVGTSQESKLNLSDPAPAAPTIVSFTTSPNAITISAVQPDKPADGTGYIIIEGDNPEFATTTAVMMMQMFTSLPYTLTSQAPGAHYFRVAMRDQFFAINPDIFSLNWSQVVTVNVPGA